MTQSQLARAIETSERNIQRWESGQNAPRVEMLARIAKATNTDTSVFLADDESGDEDDDEDPALREAFSLFVDLMGRLRERQDGVRA